MMKKFRPDAIGNEPYSVRRELRGDEGAEGELKRRLVTALIDTYNYGQFVEQAIESVLGQEYPADRLEILVVDDGSTDDTAERVKKYGERVRYFKKDNGGQASAFNFGFAEARGEIVAFLDADDYWWPTKISRVVRVFDEHPGTGLVYHRRRELDVATGESKEGEFAECSGYLPDSVAKMLAYRVAPTSSLAFRREVLERLMPMPEWIRLQADAYLALLAVFLAPVEAVNEVLSVYRLHGKNLYAAGKQAASQATQHIEMRVKIVSAAREWLEAHNFDVTKPGAEAYFEQLALALAADRFAIAEPGRMEFLQHLRRRNKLYASQSGWKLRFMNWCNAWASSLTGYKRFAGLREAEERLLSSLKHFRSGHA
jgi:glycosyltransferase involved in cell wall biosynthesis